MSRRRLPIGIQTFRELREEDCYYVDKTPYVERLLREGKHYFLSRPRRFGKSLFLDTLKEFFEGSEALFAGLYIHDRHNWSKCHPVVRLSFGGGNFKEPATLHADVMAQLDGLARDREIPVRYDIAPARFRHLLQALHKATGRRVAVLVDEYDKPILDALVEAPEVALANRDYLRGLYGVIKDCDAHVRFTFLTGISKFSKVNLFSQLNNLTDLTLDPVYSSICGYTEDDLDTVFAPELTGLDRERVREWYNGYSWLGTEKVYNPYDVLLLLRRGRFAAYWFETGTPAFLVDTLFERRVSSVSLDRTVSTEDLLSSFDVGGRTATDHIGTEALLFQTGYLTITGEEELGGEPLYRLGYPNREVRQSLNRVLLRHLVQDAERQTANSVRLARLLEAQDCAGLKELFHAFFASIPYEWHTSNDIADYEGYYASVFYSYFAALGYEIVVEESSGHGRLDMAVRTGGHVYLFEFKVAELSPPGSALAQLQDRDYAAKHRGRGEPIHLIGVEFSRRTRNVTAFEVADG
ncbi:MAG: ATP-binding protein [Spirochaetaceae bacterium]|nr:ATP-binding protein [Spirochaetaceae bacterium]